MQDSGIWNMVVKHLDGTESPVEREKFLQWYEENKNNKDLFYKIKTIWNNPGLLNENAFKQKVPLKFRERFTWQRIKDFIYKQALGNLVGFTIGMWVTTLFSRYTLERKSFKNLFGLTGRKQVVVNIIPEWLQTTIAILAGFIVLELINHFFQTKKHVMIWKYLKAKYAANK